MVVQTTKSVFLKMLHSKMHIEIVDENAWRDGFIFKTACGKAFKNGSTLTLDDASAFEPCEKCIDAAKHLVETGIDYAEPWEVDG